MLEYNLFYKLPFASQIDELTHKGTVLAQRNHKGWTITLYTLNNYFVEHWARHGLAVIGTFRKSTSSLTILDPYLDIINVPDLN